MLTGRLTFVIVAIMISQTVFDDSADIVSAHIRGARTFGHKHATQHAKTAGASTSADFTG